jgi:hypothetical protein
MSVGKKWTTNEIALLGQMARDKIGARVIAQRLKRSYYSVMSKAKQLGISVEPSESTQAVPSTPDPGHAVNPKELERERRVHARQLTAIKAMIESHEGPVEEYFRKKASFALCGDTQFGSLYDRHDLVEKTYSICKRMGIKTVYHTGDMLDGIKMYRGHEYELEVNGEDDQVKHCVGTYPEVKGITTRFITGNHDYSFWRNGGSMVGPKIAARDGAGNKLSGLRDDMVYLGQDEAMVVLNIDGTEIRMMLRHPAKGTAYALSYQPQKLVESLPGGRKPEILAIGHYHKAEFIPVLRNIFTFQTGCLQSQTPHMRTRHIEAHMGFWAVEARATKTGMARVRGEFVGFYET